MKKALSFLLTLSLLLCCALPALAIDTDPPEAEQSNAEQSDVEQSDVEQSDTEQSNPEQDDTEQVSSSEAGPVSICTIDELQASVATAEDGDTLALSSTILLDGVTLATDKALTLTTASDFCNTNLVELHNGAMISGFSFAYDGDCTAVCIRNSSATAIVRNCSFDCASAVYVIGNMDGDPTTAYIEGCAFSHAQSSAVNVMAFANVEIESCTFTQNTTAAQGGAVRNNGTLSISNSTITDNSATSGGGVFNNGTLTLSNTVIRSNTSTNTDFGADIFSLGILALTDEQTEGAGYYEETTGEKIALPLSSCSDTAKLVYLTDEEAAQRFAAPSADEPQEDEEQDPPDDTTPPTTTPTTPTYTPPIYTPPSYRPPVTHIPTREDTPAKEEKPAETPAPAPALVCGEAVIDVSRSVVLYGYEDGLLHLEDSLTRGQMATIIYRLLDENTLALYDTAETVFTDVPADMWCCRYISTIAKAGIVAGTGNGCYDPNSRLTWAQIITVLSRFIEPQSYTLQYISYDGWAVDTVKTAVALDWIKDSADFDPSRTITRGEFMDFVNGVLALYRTD